MYMSFFCSSYRSTHAFNGWLVSSSALLASDLMGAFPPSWNLSSSHRCSVVLISTLKWVRKVQCSLLDCVFVLLDAVLGSLSIWKSWWLTQCFLTPRLLFWLGNLQISQSQKYYILSVFSRLCKVFLVFLWAFWKWAILLTRNRLGGQLWSSPVILIFLSTTGSILPFCSYSHWPELWILSY